MEKLKLGVVGLGQRGFGMLGTFLLFDEVDVVAVCDAYADRNKRAADLVKEKRGVNPKIYEKFEDMLADDDIKAVYVASSWDEHIRMGIACMRAGKITALEVGGAYDVEECWELVKAYEETKTPIMFMENCCYDRFELLTTALERKGMLGEVVHCHGSYSHDLRDEILGGVVNRHYRLDNYKNRNCDNYPTHEFGPIAKLIGINRGNRMLTLSSVASKAVGLAAFTVDDRNPDKNQIGQKFRQGDIISTVITCAGGETVTLTLDTTLPRFYSREFTVRSTKGICMQDANLIMLEGREDFHEFWEPHLVLEKQLNSANNYKDYLPPIWKNITEEEMKAGHGGMDYLMLKSFIFHALGDKVMPIDVYDAAAWMCITPLTEQSISLGGAPVPVPDFTVGKWIKRGRKDVTDFD